MAIVSDSPDAGAENRAEDSPKPGEAASRAGEAEPRVAPPVRKEKDPRADALRRNLQRRKAHRRSQRQDAPPS